MWVAEVWAQCNLRTRKKSWECFVVLSREVSIWIHNPLISETPAHVHIISWWVPAVSDPRNTAGNLGETIWALHSKADWAGLALGSNCKERLLITSFSLWKHKKEKKKNPTSRAWIGQSPLYSCKRNDRDGNEVDWWWLASLSIISEKSVEINRDQCLPWEAVTGTMPLPSRISSLESGKIGQCHYYIYSNGKLKVYCRVHFSNGKLYAGSSRSIVHQSTGLKDIPSASIRIGIMWCRC